MFLLKSSRKWVPVNMIFLLNGTKNQKFGKFFPIMSPLRHKIQNSFSILERTLRIIYDLWAPVMWPCYALTQESQLIMNKVLPSLCTNIISVVKLQRWWVLKSKFGTFWQTVIHCIYKIQWSPWSTLAISNFSCMFLNPIFFSDLNYNCSNSLYMRNLQEEVKKTFCYQKLFWPFTAVHCLNKLF